MTTRWQCCSTLSKGSIGPLSEAHGAIRQPQLPLRQQEHLSVEAELSCHWVAHLDHRTANRATLQAGQCNSSPLHFKHLDISSCS